MAEPTRVTINKTEYFIHFGTNALRKYCTMAGKTLKDLDKLGEAMDLNDVILLIIAGLNDGARKTNSEFKLSPDELADEFDLDPNAIEKCINVFAQSQATGNLTAGTAKK